MRRALAIGTICLAAALGGCGGDDGDDAASDPTTAAPSEPAPTTTAPEQPQAAEGCEEAATPSTREREGQKPRRDLEAGRKYRLVVTTNCGEFTIALDQKAAPKASASLVALAHDKFFDGVVFHRIVPGFVIQGGDPTATGSGGPGYSTVDRPPSNTRYTKGVVAMAKAGREPAGTAGSQFFVVVGEDAGLPPDYAVVGRVTDGMDVVERIGELGDPATERPTANVVIESVRVEDSR
jgi:peptidyl-prolyl cis-trans isomerase B (cyclophilin B)